MRTSGKRAAKLEAAAKAVAQADESHGTYPPELLQQAKGRPSIDINDPVSYTHLTLPTICSV